MARLAPPIRLGRLAPLQMLHTRSGRLSYVISGSGPATLLLFNGAGVSLEGWQALYPAIERLGRVFAWNRFGVRGSDPPAAPQTGSAVLASLREVLSHAQLGPPYVLVGHSLGGLHANLFARTYPAEVAGVLLVEAAHPRDREVLRKHETQFARAISRVFELPQRLFRRNLHSEVDCIDATVREIEAAGPFPPVPLIVVTGGKTPPGWMMSPAAVGARRMHQQELARLSPRGEQVIAQGSGHFPQLTEPALVLDCLQRLLEACRTGPAPCHPPA